MKPPETPPLTRLAALWQGGPRAWWRELPAYVINGIAVALGIALLQLSVHALAGALAAQLALVGAVCASLADVPNTVRRTLQRVASAALLACLSAAAVVLLRPWPLALGAGVGLIAFGAMMTMAWGPRAGAVSFAPILALGFTLAAPPGSAPLAQIIGWNAFGGLAYLGWSLLAGRALQSRYRALALAQALASAARLLRARCALLTAPGADNRESMRAWIAGEAELAERLQSARDFVFDPPDSATARTQTSSLLQVIELRDLLLASRLDLELLGHDATAQSLEQRLAQGLQAIAAALDMAVHIVRHGDLASAPAPAPDFTGWFDSAALAAGDLRLRLLPAMEYRLTRMSALSQRLLALQRGASSAPPLNRDELQRFVAAEGWPLAALRTQLTLASPVLRHALRTGLALSCAYFVGLAVPWDSHPHWLVLSVAVVLRLTLAQTLARRNARVLGTLLGCAVVLALSPVSSLFWLSLIFLVAIGTAHAFVLQRYWLTACAATVMALLQTHMLNPSAGFAIPERVADTLLGAVLGWGFSYVLPSWEKRSLPMAVSRLLKALDDYADQALRQDAPDKVAPRLARRRAYDALGALNAALQRSAAEPRAVRAPEAELARLLDHGQHLMAHLSLVRLALVNRRAALSDDDATTSLAAARMRLGLWLAPASDDGPGPPSARDSEPLPHLPELAPSEDIMPWLEWRLAMLVHEASCIARAAEATLTALRAD